MVNPGAEIRWRLEEIVQPMKAEQKTTSDPVSISDASYFDREVSWLRMDARRARWITLAVLSALVLYLVIIASLATGPINIFHNDVFILLDDGWRVLNGQVPHRDFYSPLGPLEYWIVAGGMLVTNGGPQGIAIGIAVFGLVIGIWGWVLARRRMLPLFGLLVTAWLVLTATSPTPLGFDSRFLSCAMIYNRQGYALLGIILLECAFAQERSRFWGGVSSGVALILLAFLKLNFFGVGGLFLLASVPLTRAELARMWGFLAGVAGTILAFLLYPRFSMAAFFSDMQFVSRARGSALNPPGIIHGIVTCAQSGTVWLVLAMAIGILSFGPAKRWHRQTVSFALLTIIVLASGPLFLQTNSLENRCQLASLWLIILLEKVSAIHLSLHRKKTTIIFIALSLGVLIATLVPDFASAFNLMQFDMAAKKALATHIAAPGVESLSIYDSTSFFDINMKESDGNGSYYAHCVNDGLALLKAQSPAPESILALGFHNPFSYLLRRKPAEGGSSYLYLGNSITESHMPTVDRVFGNADVMILPDHEGTHRDSDQFIQNYYRPYLLQNFHFVARSECWQLYRRNK